jgi:hypothetical protein
MTEGLFVLIIIYAAYVFYVVFEGKKTLATFTIPVATSEKQAVATDFSSFETLLPKTEIAKTQTTSEVKKPATSKLTTPKKGLKDPKTGEVATSYSNYRFSKRWIKEALVTEGLLEKIYKNNELTSEIEISIKEAITRLESLDQYKV